MEMPKKRAVGYVRVSSDCQTENTSIELQTEKINDYCKLYDYELVRVFADNGRTGSKVDCRESYREMMSYISSQENEIEALIVVKADRIHRKLKNLLVMIEDYLQPKEVAFISITENFDTSTCQGMLFLQMIGSFAEFERQVINERTRSGRVKTAADRQYAGGQPAFGYKVQGKNLVIDEAHALTVANIFKLCIQGKSTQYIAKMLNDRGIPTKTGNTSWSRQTVAYILSNPIYSGTYTYNGKTEKNQIVNQSQVPALVSMRTWNKAQRIKNSRVKNALA